MSKTWTVISLSLLALAACAKSRSDKGENQVAGCHLKTPVVLPGDPTASDPNPPVFLFKNVRLDRIPSTEPFSTFVNGELKLRIGQVMVRPHVYANPTPIGYLAIRISNERSLGFGISDVYEGQFDLSGGSTQIDGVTTYNTRDAQSLRSIQMSVVNGMITAIQLQQPFSSIEPETICVEEMTYDRTQSSAGGPASRGPISN